MPIREDDVRHVATLARLALTDEQVGRLTGELGSILGHIDELSKLDLEGVEPTAHPLDMTNSMREDTPAPCLSREDALRNAPEAADGAFVIPRIVGVGGEG